MRTAFSPRSTVQNTRRSRTHRSRWWIPVAALVLFAGMIWPVGAASAIPTPAPPSPQSLGPNVLIFNPSMPQTQIQAAVDGVAAQQIGNQFGTQRYALLFQPGTYGSSADPLTFDVGYYTQVAGLGKEPTDVVINGSINVHNQCFPTTDGSSNCIALDNFWRSLSNLSIDVAGGEGCQSNTEFWAVSQAAPMRRVSVAGGVSLMDYCSAGPQYASGGFIADSKFTGATVTNGSQQQFLVRNSELDGWTNGVWNQVFTGDVGAPTTNFGDALKGVYTTLPTSPVTADEPYLYTDTTGALLVMVPKVQRNSVGTSWSGATGTAGGSRALRDFLVADPSTSITTINYALARGKSLILTPGVYALKQAIQVSRPDTVVLGLGFPTLVPQSGHAAVKVWDVPGSKISGIIIDAGKVNSPVLMQVGSSSRPGFDCGGRPSDPTQIQDVFFRIGGATAGRATTSLMVNSSDVILDDIWAWRADHGTGVGWTQNTADHGVIVNGNDVTAYGLFVEHYQKTEVIWNGQDGKDIFFQNEMPYDPPSQAAWRASRTFNGYPAFQVSPTVRTFRGYGMGSYSFFNQGIDIHATTAFVAPQTRAVKFQSVLTRFLDGSGGIDSVINRTGAPVTADNAGPSNVVSYP